MFDRLRKFLKEVRVELTKVTWPTMSELRGSTFVVIVTVLILTIFIGLVDLGLSRLMALLLRLG
jgi:preprotein translocase subunit SecE